MPARWLLEATTPGSTMAVVGRPGSGVSTTLARIAVEAAGNGMHAVLASWERPPGAWGEVVRTHPVVLPEILGWDIGQLERCTELQEAGPDSVVLVDHLNLVSGAKEDIVARLVALAVANGWRVVLGVMATRDLGVLTTDVAPAWAVRDVGQHLASIVHHVDRMVVLTGGDNVPRHISLARKPSTDGAPWTLARTEAA